MEPFWKSRTGCFPICLPCSYCEYGTSSAKWGPQSVVLQGWSRLPVNQRLESPMPTLSFRLSYGVHIEPLRFLT